MLAGSPAEPRPGRAVHHRRGTSTASCSPRMHGADPLPGTLARLGIPVVVQRPAARPRRRCRTSTSTTSAASPQRGPAPGRPRPAPDRHHRRPAGHGRRDRPAQPATAARAARRRPALDRGRRRLHPASPGAAAMRQLLADDPDLDAVFVASDLMAHGALRTLREAGRRVPDDVAVVGFDDIETAALHRAAADHRPAADRRTRPHDGPPAAPAGRRREDRAGGHAPHRADPPRLRLTTRPTPAAAPPAPDGRGVRAARLLRPTPPAPRKIRTTVRVDVVASRRRPRPPSRLKCCTAQVGLAAARRRRSTVAPGDHVGAASAGDAEPGDRCSRRPARA